MTDRTPIQAAMPVAAKALNRLRPYTSRIELAGSIRRLRPRVKDIEIVAVPAQVPAGLFGEPRLALDEIRQVCETAGHIVKSGDRMIQVARIFGSPLTLDLFLVHEPAEWGPIFAIRTGPADYSQMLVTRIKGRLWSCRGGHVRDDRGERVPCPEEEDFFQAAQVEWVTPEDREVTP